MIELKHLSKIYDNGKTKVEAIRDINLTIEDGDIFGIIGLSGAGKSTLIRCINFLEKPTEGQVIFDGVDLGTISHKELLKKRQSMSMIFQNFNLLSKRTACLLYTSFKAAFPGQRKLCIHIKFIFIWKF